MSSGWEPGQPRERRATDGLDWATQRPTEAQPATPEPPSAPAGAASPSQPQPEPAGPLPAAEVSPPPSQSRRPGLIAFGLVAGSAAVIGGLIAGFAVAFLSGDDDGDAASGGESGGGSTLTVEQTSAVTDAAEKFAPSVVKIESTRRTPQGIETDTGSGIVVDGNGHIVTNAHVVLNTDTLKVYLADGTERRAILLGHDFPFTDLAVLQIGPGNLTPAVIGDSSALKLGETIVAIGNPLAEFDGSVSVGVVSGLNRTRNFDGVKQTDIVQTDAALNQGNSGGALVNLRGEFVGMPTAVLRTSRSGQVVEGISFALPSNRVMEIAGRIIADGASYPRPTIGADTVDLSDDVLARLPRVAVDEGAIVMALDPTGPAAKAGIAAGDVITRFGDTDITSDMPFLNALMTHQPDETVRVVLNRNGRIIEVNVRLGKRA